MTDEKQLDMFKYFVESYFNLSMDYEELESVIKEFLQAESTGRILELKREVKILYDMDSTDFVRNFVLKYGKRRLNDERVIGMLILLNTKLRL